MEIHTKKWYFQVPEYDLPNCFNVGNMGQESSLMDILEIAGSQLDFESGFANPDIKSDYGGKKSELNSILDYCISNVIIEFAF